MKILNLATTTTTTKKREREKKRKEKEAMHRKKPVSFIYKTLCARDNTMHVSGYAAMLLKHLCQ
jgi:hypothetical protein